MRGRSAVSTDLDGLYAAQRLTMVRLAALLVGDRDVAESVVQRAFLVLLRRHDRRADPGTAVAELRSQVVAGCRAVLRGRRDEPAPASVRDTADDVRRLPPRQREVVVLEVWARLSRPQTAATLRVGERTVAAARTSALAALRRPDEPADGTATLDRVAEALERQADAIGADDLRRRFGEVLDEDARRTARQRRWWLVAVAALIAVAVVVAVVTGVQHYTGPSPTPTPAPTPSATPTQPDSPLSSPALAPGEQHARRHPVVRGRRRLGRDRDRLSPHRGDDDPPPGEPDRDPLRHRQRVRRHRRPGRQRRRSARPGRGGGPGRGLGPPGRDRASGGDAVRLEVAALQRTGPELRLPRAVDRQQLVGTSGALDLRTATCAPTTTRRSPAPPAAHAIPASWSAPTGPRPCSPRGTVRSCCWTSPPTRWPVPAPSPSHRPASRSGAGRGPRRSSAAARRCRSTPTTASSASPSSSRRSERAPTRAAVVWATTGSPSSSWTTSAPGRWRPSRPTVTSRRSPCRRPRPAWSPTSPSAARCSSAAPAALRTATAWSPTTSAPGRVTDLAGPGAGGRTVRQAFVLTTAA